MNQRNATILNNYSITAASFTGMNLNGKHKFLNDLLLIIEAEEYLLSYMRLHLDMYKCESHCSQVDNVPLDFQKAVLIWKSRFYSIVDFFDNVLKIIHDNSQELELYNTQELELYNNVLHNSQELELYNNVLSQWSTFFQQGLDNIILFKKFIYCNA